jgi:hypothetical protein
MSLEAILKEIKVQKPFAEENVDNGPAETLNGRRGRKHQAIEQIMQLKRAYKQNMLKTSAFVIVTGSLRKEFEEIATNKKFKLFSADPELFYNDLANRVPPSMYQGNESVVNMFDILGRHLEDKMNELDVFEYNQLIFKAKYVKSIKNPKEFSGLIKEAINEQMGAEIVGIQSVTSIIDKAIEANHFGTTTSIILGTDDESLVTDLTRDLEKLTNRIFLVVAGESKVKAPATVTLQEVTEKTAKQALDTIRSMMKR